jgi:hypothetical protein
LDRVWYSLSAKRGGIKFGSVATCVFVTVFAKHVSLLQHSIYYGGKRLYDTGP